MNMIRKYLYRLVPAFCMVCALSACTAEDDSESPSSGRSEGLVVGFTAQYAADEFPTRATEGKTNFEDGDVIHITAQFYVGEANQGIDGTPQGTPQYCAYRYVKGDWISMMNNHEITWPYACDYGMFTAYYVSQADGPISDESGASTSCMLSDIAEVGTSDNTVPLKAGPVPFNFGHTVNLTFTHLCARLSVTQLDASTVNEYWLTKPDDSGFHNAYRLKRSPQKGVEIEWQSLPTEGYEKYGTYIARSQDTKVPDEYGRTVTFYLEPGASFSGCKLGYRYNRNYLTLNSEKLSKLESNHSYRLNITQDTGIVYDDPDDGGWSHPDDSTKAHKLINIPGFLTAAGKGDDFTDEDGTQILQQTGTGIILLKDLDFSGRDPLSDNDFPETHLDALRNLITSVTFDGDFHYIYNAVRPIFNEIQGRLYNLGISNTKRKGEVHLGTPGYGGLSRSVIASGIISNVHISNLDLELILPESATGVYSISCVTGNNYGTVSDIKVRGQININVAMKNPSGKIQSEIYTGGIIGQNLGTLSGCSVFTTGDGDTTPTCINISNSCASTLSMSTGGIVGFSTNHIENVTLAVKVDAGQSTASENYTGGMAGRLRRSTGETTRKDFKNISVEGSVKGGQGVATTGSGKSFTGGITGRLFNFYIDNCNSLCDVEGWNGDLSPNVRYATGGAFGCIATSDVDELVFNTNWYGNTLSGQANEPDKDCYLGTFSGIIPIHRTDEGYKGNGNNARDRDGISFSGANVADTSTNEGLPNETR